MDTIALLTGSIKPIKQEFLLLVDSEVRCKNYEEAIRYYILESDFSKLIFIENTNSGHILDFLIEEASKVGKLLEILTFQGNNKELLKKGKGFGECESIEYVINNSKLLKQNDLIIKITGRYKILNINNIIDKLNTDYPSFIRIRFNNMIDALLFSFFSTTWTKNFATAKEQINDKQARYIEHVIFDLIKQNRVDVRKLPVYPIYVETSGTSGNVVDKRHSLHRIMIYTGVLTINSTVGDFLAQVLNALRFVRKFFYTIFKTITGIYDS